MTRRALFALIPPAIAALTARKTPLTRTRRDTCTSLRVANPDAWFILTGPYGATLHTSGIPGDTLRRASAELAREADLFAAQVLDWRPGAQYPFCAFRASRRSSRLCAWSA